MNIAEEVVDISSSIIRFIGDIAYELDTPTLIFVLMGGIIPPIIWLWFWLKEDKKKPEPKPLIVATFIGGMIAVPVALYFEKIIAEKWWIGADSAISTGGSIFLGVLIMLVAIEEIVKYLAAQGIAFPDRHFDEPIDAVIYMLTAALGFAALENTLFLINNLTEAPIIEVGGVVLNNVSEAIISNNLRFIGANVVHVVSSGIIGVFIGLSFYSGMFKKISYLLLGVISAITLHTLFNFLIIRFSDRPLIVFSLMWIAAIGLILLFEKVKRVKA